jgi:tetratricopeptide (TPR) repeat protein
MRSLSKLQWSLIISAILLVVVLYNLDIIAPNTSKGGQAESQNTETASTLNFEELKSTALKSVPAEVKSNITLLEKKLKEASADQEKESRLALADAYFAYKQYAVAGFYFLEQSEKEASNADLFVKAGDAFRDAYRNSTDSNLSPLLMEKARTSYEKALKIAPANLDAKTGVATCFVEGSENPMQGITLLREVVQADPENVNANLNLGLFSMKSGQFDKAISRFETVVKKKPSAENYALLAEAFEQSGDKKSAIKALTKAKEYVIDPQIVKGIDDYIKTLEK